MPRQTFQFDIEWMAGDESYDVEAITELLNDNIGPSHDNRISNVKDVTDKALTALKEFMEWGAKTGSDRNLFDNRFKNILNEAGVRFDEPE